MVPLSVVFGFIIAGTAAVAAASAREVLRGRSAAVPGADPAAAGIIAVIAGVASASGITIALLLSGRAGTAFWALACAWAVVLLTGGGYLAGLRARTAPALPAAGPPAAPVSRPPSWSADTLEFNWDDEIARLLRGQADGRSGGSIRPFPWPGRRHPPPPGRPHSGPGQGPGPC